MKSQKGFTLLEVLIALAIIGITAAGFMGALTTSTQTAMKTDQIDTARTIAQTQMEYVKKQAFSAAGSYSRNDSIMEEYPNYTAVISTSPAAERDSYIQKITVTVSYNGRTIATLEDFKAKR